MLGTMRMLTRMKNLTNETIIIALITIIITVLVLVLVLVVVVFESKQP